MRPWARATRSEAGPLTRAPGRRRGPPPLAVASYAVLACLFAAALLAPVIAPYDMREQDLLARLQPPSWLGGAEGHWLGTDHLGRDVLSRLLHALRTTLGVATLGTLIGLALGSALGLAAGLAGGWVDELIMFLVDVQVSVPFVLVALTAIALGGTSKAVLVLVVGLAGWEVYARVVRGQVLALGRLPFVEAARALGATGGRIALRHLLPSVSTSLVVLATANFTHVMLLESALSFLGIGVRPPDTSLGAMLGTTRDYLLTDWTLPAAPAATLVLLSVAVSVLGDWARDRLDPRQRG